MIQPVDVVSMYVNNNNGFHGNQGHNHGGKGGNSKKERLVCTYCGLTSHIADKCYKLHGYPPGYKLKGGNKAMANQVFAMLPFGNFGLVVFPSTLNVGLPIVGALPTGVLPNVCAQSEIVPTSPNFLGHSFGGSHLQASSQTSLYQCPLSQVQCEQLLNFLKNYVAPESGNGTQGTHQVASVMAPNSSIPQISTSTSTSPSCSSNFSSNPYWILPNLSHSIFSAQVVDRHAYKSNT